MLASDWSTRDHEITVDKSEAPRTPVSRFYLRRYFGGDWEHALNYTLGTEQLKPNIHSTGHNFPANFIARPPPPVSFI